MNKGSIILLFVICINIVGFGFAFACTDSGVSCGENFDNSVINFFFDVDSETNLNNVDGLSVNETFRSNIEGSLTQEPGVATLTGLGAIGFLDVVKMTIGLFSLLTPFPLLVLLYSFGLPLLYMMLISIPVFALYGLAILEMMRGVQF